MKQTNPPLFNSPLFYDEPGEKPVRSHALTTAFQPTPARVWAFVAALIAFCLLAAFNAPRTHAHEKDFSDIIEKHARAVVQIEVSNEAVSSGRSGRNPREPGRDNSELLEFFERYFGFSIPGFPERDRERSLPDRSPPRRSFGWGSGFIVDSEGRIVTNAHVVEGGTRIRVKLHDRREYIAEVLGVDKSTDLALLKINASGPLPKVRFGRSEDLRLGQWVFAIGSPYGFDYTVTRGIVSGLARRLPDSNYVPFIQTDAAVNPGNSGGPLFNTKGQVIGVNSQIFSASGSFAGLSFAIPSDVVVDIVEQLEKEGEVNRGWLGIAFQEVDQELASSFGLSSPKGALVTQVLPDSPAEKAGIEDGDIILRYGNTPLKHSRDLPPLVGGTRSGKRVQLTLLRDGRERRLDVKIGRLDDRDGVQAFSGAPAADNALGMRLKDNDADGPARGQGVVVAAMAADGRAALAGIEVDDLILRIDGKLVQSVEEAEALIRAADAKPLQMLVLRLQPTRRYLAIVVD